MSAQPDASDTSSDGPAIMDTQNPLIVSVQGVHDAEVLVAHLASGDEAAAEQLLDRHTLADLVHEAIEQSQRARGADAQTSWWDAAAAADLILFHVTQLTGDPG